jgi:acetyl-CoA C-acetyltransferase
MQDIFLIDGLRTAIGTYGGSLAGIPVTQLTTDVTKKLLEKNSLDPKIVEAIVMGCVFSAGDVHNPARVVGYNVGVDEDCAAYTVNRLCGSGMQAIINAVMEIQTGNAEIALALGGENMSRYPHMTLDFRWGKKYGDLNLIDGVGEVLSDPMDKYPAGLLGENCASEYQISRQEQDQFAYESQMKAANAIANGYFKEQIVPIQTPKGIFEIDEHPKSTTLEKLAQLRPVFKKDGTLTAGNSSGVNDGAAAVLIANQNAVKKFGLKPMAKIVAYAQAGNNHHLMGYAPVLSSQKVLQKANMKLEQMDLIEINEAFAAQVLAVEKGLQWDRNKVNVNGGAIALGHPLGMSGVRLTIMLAYELRRRNLQFGLATICIGGGMGLSLILENLS